MFLLKVTRLNKSIIKNKKSFVAKNQNISVFRSPEGRVRENPKISLMNCLGDKIKNGNNRTKPAAKSPKDKFIRGFHFFLINK